MKKIFLVMTLVFLTPMIWASIDNVPCTTSDSKYYHRLYCSKKSQQSVCRYSQEGEVSIKCIYDQSIIEHTNVSESLLDRGKSLGLQDTEFIPRETISKRH